VLHYAYLRRKMLRW